MNIQIMSDIHCEHHYDYGTNFIANLDSEGVDVLILAGDICTYTMRKNVFPAFCSKYPHVIWVPGNHFYACGHRHSAQEIDLSLAKLDREIDNLHVLNPGIFELGGIKFVGATLWYSQDPTVESFKKSFFDFASIKDFDPWVYQKNAGDVDFLIKHMPTADVVITHHMPTHKSVSARWATSVTNPFFVCDISEYIEEAEPQIVIHGHTHDRVDYMLGNSRVLCNPYGYSSETATRRNFDAKLLVSLEPRGLDGS